jgi:stage III sporulation protein AF
MREVVYAWAQQLVFLILFVTVVEMILPAGELRRYTKMVVGLVVILAVLDPLLQVVQVPLFERFVAKQTTMKRNGSRHTLD